MFEKKEQPVSMFEFHRSENGGCLAREPNGSGRIWLFKDVAEFVAWVERTIVLKKKD